MPDIKSILNNLVIPNLERRLLAKAMQDLHVKLCPACQAELVNLMDSLASTLGSSRPSIPASPTQPVSASPKK